MTLRIFLLQRATAVLLVPLILIHLIVIFYATAQGVSAAAILGRTQGSVIWGLFYCVFVLAAAIHGAIGLHNVFAEWGPKHAKGNPRILAVILWGSGLCLAGLGLRAVYAVVVP